MELPERSAAATAEADTYSIPAHLDCAPCNRNSDGHFSIRTHFDESCNVLLTGASGYIGSLVLEKLLRSTSVGRVYLFMRPRRGVPPSERLTKLLRGPLFHLISEEQAARVTVVAGDILEARLGLSAEDEALLVDRIDTVIHSAADIRLDAPIHDTLTANYLGSCSVASLAARMQRLRSFVYVSTCYVNINKPKGTRVEERLYPLLVGGKEVDARGIAEELLELPSAEAEALAAKYIDLWGFKNTYALGKHLAEKAVVRLQQEFNLPLVIVRPSLVSGVAAEPYVGYTGNFAGQVGGAVAYMVGLYNDQPEAAASNGDSLWDVVPGDVVAHATIAAAAAAACASSRERIVAPLRCSGKAGQQQGAQEREQQPPMVIHVNSSCTYPLTMATMFNDGVVWCAAHRRPFTLALRRAKGMDPHQRYNESAWRRHMRTAANKVNALAWVLRLLGGKPRMRLARMLDAGLRTYETINEYRYDLQLCFNSGTLLRLEECLSPEERPDFRIVWRPPTSQSHPAAPSGPSKPGSAAALAPCEPRDVSAVADGSSRAAPAALTKGKGGAKDAAAAAAAAAGSSRLAAAAQLSQEGGWTLFHYNMLAYLWRVIYARDAPEEAHLSKAALRRLMPHLSEEEVAANTRLRHNFVHVA